MACIGSPRSSNDKQDFDPALKMACREHDNHKNTNKGYQYSNQKIGWRRENTQDRANMRALGIRQGNTPVAKYRSNNWKGGNVCVLYFEGLNVRFFFQAIHL